MVKFCTPWAHLLPWRHLGRGIEEMKWIPVLVPLVCGMLFACAGTTQSGSDGTTPGTSGPDEMGQRFQALEASSRELNVEILGELPEVAEDDTFLVVEAVLSAPSYDSEQSGWALSPPEEWTVGSTTEGEEVRLEFLEPEGGAMIVSGPADVTLEGEVTVTWLVRYSRRNTLLTEAGTAVAVHVVPVAAMLVADDQPPRYWISGEAP